jgi:hypothetical protein
LFRPACFTEGGRFVAWWDVASYDSAENSCVKASSASGQTMVDDLILKVLIALRQL